jgi:hypothetical protein
MTGKYLEASPQLLVGSLTNPVGVLLFMTPPGAECTTGAFEIPKVWPTGDMPENGLIARQAAKAGQEIGRGRTKMADKMPRHAQR